MMGNPHPGNQVALWATNERRHVERIPRQVELARRALPYARTDHQRDALRLRLNFPSATLTDLARLSGLTKDAYWSRLRLGMQSAR